MLERKQPGLLRPTSLLIPSGQQNQGSSWSDSQLMFNSRPSFILAGNDLGAGEVDLVLARGVGSATFTRATTATTFGPSNWLVLPGTSGNYASTPDSAAVSITGDIDIRVKVALDDWTPATANAVMGKIDSSDNRSYYFSVNSGATVGKLQLATSPDGLASSEVLGRSTVATGFTDGTVHWVRVTLDVNDGGGNRVYNFYTSEDGETWDQLGTTVTTAGATTIFDGDSALEVGSIFAGTLFNVSGKIYANLSIVKRIYADIYANRHLAGNIFLPNSREPE